MLINRHAHTHQQKVFYPDTKYFANAHPIIVVYMITSSYYQVLVSKVPDIVVT